MRFLSYRIENGGSIALGALTFTDERMVFNLGAAAEYQTLSGGEFLQ